MRVLLVSANTEKIGMPTIPLGLGCVLASVRAAGHEAGMIDLMDLDDPGGCAPFIGRAVEDLRPDVIGLSIRNIDNQDMKTPLLLIEKARAVVAACRAFSGAPVVLGGAGFSISPAGALDYLDADAGVRGEGEGAFVELLAGLSGGARLEELPFLYTRGREGAQGKVCAAALDAFPLPGPEVWSGAYLKAPDLWMPFQSRRGCARRCIYCSTGLVEGERVRRRSVETVVRSLAHYAEAGYRRFYFTDNTFNLPRSYALALCRRMIREGLDLTWRAIVYPGGVDEELSRAMARSGCTEVSVGIESGSARILESLGKDYRLDDVRSSMAHLAAQGIRRNGFLLFGGPGETRESVQESLDFADSLGLESVKATVGLRIYPQTPLARRALGEGVIAGGDVLFRPRFYCAGPPADWVRDAVAAHAAGRPEWLV